MSHPAGRTHIYVVGGGSIDKSYWIYDEYIEIPNNIDVAIEFLHSPLKSVQTANIRRNRIILSVSRPNTKGN
jgi:hypothetical protein